MVPLIILAIVEFVRGALVFSLIPLYGQFVVGFNLGIIGTAISMHYLMDNIFRLIAGWMTDRFGGKWIMTGGLVLSSLGLYLLYTSRTGSQYILAAGLFGFGVAPVWPVVISGVAAKIPSHRISEALSTVFIAWLVGAGLGPVVINFVIGKSYRLGFLLLIGTLIIALFLAFFGKEQRVVIDKVLNVSSFLKELWEEIIALKILYPGMFVQTMAVGIIMPVITIYAKTVYGISTEQFSYLLIGGGIFTVLLLIPAGKISDRLGIKIPLIGGFLLAAICLVVLPFIRSIRYALVAGAFLGISYSFILPAWNGLQARVVSPEKRGTMWAIFMTIEGVGTAFGALVGGKVWDNFGHQAPFLTSAFVLVFMAVFYAVGNLNKLMKTAAGE